MISLQITLAELEALLQTTKPAEIASDIGIGLHKFRQHILKAAGFHYKSRKWCYAGERNPHMTSIQHILEQQTEVKITSQTSQPIKSFDVVKQELSFEEMDFLAQPMVWQSEYPETDTLQNEYEDEHHHSNAVTLSEQVFEQLQVYCLQQNVPVEDFLSLAIIEAIEKYKYE